jgi:hypothetical protein
MTPARFPHSDTPGSTLGCQLPRAYRRLLRPSSALDAKASTMCPSQLVTHTTNPTHPPKPEGRRDRRCTPTRHKKTRTPPGQSTRGHAHNKQPHASTTPSPAPRGMRPHDARVHYPDLKQQPHTTPDPAHHGTRERPGTRSLSHPRPRNGGPGLTADPSEPQQCVCLPTPVCFHIPNSTIAPPPNPAGTAPTRDDDRCRCSLERR